MPQRDKNAATTPPPPRLKTPTARKGGEGAGGRVVHHERRQHHENGRPNERRECRRMQMTRTTTAPAASSPRRTPRRRHPPENKTPATLANGVGAGCGRSASAQTRRVVRAAGRWAAHFYRSLPLISRRQGPPPRRSPATSRAYCAPALAQPPIARTPHYRQVRGATPAPPYCRRRRRQRQPPSSHLLDRINLASRSRQTIKIKKKNI